MQGVKADTLTKKYHRWTVLAFLRFFQSLCFVKAAKPSGKRANSSAFVSNGARTKNKMHPAHPMHPNVPVKTVGTADTEPPFICREPLNFRIEPLNFHTEPPFFRAEPLYLQFLGA